MKTHKRQVRCRVKCKHGTPDTKERSEISNLKAQIFLGFSYEILNLKFGISLIRYDYEKHQNYALDVFVRSLRVGLSSSSDKCAADKTCRP
jgi:hypothetical protein